MASIAAFFGVDRHRAGSKIIPRKRDTMSGQQITAPLAVSWRRGASASHMAMPRFLHTKWL
ncbi:MAG: hypothetical protein ABS59_05180 [Methylobacterium sp. SCN 67-24]|nr:MAG: hypothetical protein ABS59_05180 [Methylobacterium sp. SCN 67-24]